LSQPPEYQSQQTQIIGDMAGRISTPRRGGFTGHEFVEDRQAMDVLVLLCQSTMNRLRGRKRIKHIYIIVQPKSLTVRYLKSP